jgi:hypothetical protein
LLNVRAPMPTVRPPSAVGSRPDVLPVRVNRVGRGASHPTGWTGTVAPRCSLSCGARTPPG